MARRGAQEKTIAELKGEFALDVVPTRDYAANSAWQRIGILARNLIRRFRPRRQRRGQFGASA